MVSSNNMVWSQMSPCRDNVQAGGCLVSLDKYEQPEGRFSINVPIFEMKLDVILMFRMTLSNTNAHLVSIGKIDLAHLEARLILVGKLSKFLTRDVARCLKRA